MKAQIFNYNTWIKETDPEILFNYYKGLLLKAGFEILNTVTHKFKPIGYTALFLLGESHFAIHSFPEEGKSYIELSSCVKDKYDIFLESINV